MEPDLYPSITSGELNWAARLAVPKIKTPPQAYYEPAVKNALVQAICLLVEAMRLGPIDFRSGKVVAGEMAKEPHALLIDFLRKAHQDCPPTS